jgi:hypothetical protein
MALRELFHIITNELVTPVLVAAATGLVLWLREKLVKKTRRLFDIRISADKNDKIQDLLLEVRFRLEADRSYLTMIHNGDRYTEGSEILKASRTNESVAQGVSMEAQHYQNVLLSLIPDEMRLVIESGPSFVKTVDLADGKFKRMLESRGIKCVARCAIRRGKDIIGYIGLDYSRDIDPPPHIDDLCKYAGILEQILSEYR